MLRKNMTPEERHLWYDFLKTYPIRFNRQKIIGKYIVDFYSAKAKLIIELDGSQHYEKMVLIKMLSALNFSISMDLLLLEYQTMKSNKILEVFANI